MQHHRQPGAQWQLTVCVLQWYTYSQQCTGSLPAGIGPYELWRAKLLAEMGYVGFVADVRGCTARTAQPEHRLKWLPGHNTPHSAHASAAAPQECTSERVRCGGPHSELLEDHMVLMHLPARLHASISILLPERRHMCVMTPPACPSVSSRTSPLLSCQLCCCRSMVPPSCRDPPCQRPTGLHWTR